MNIIAITCTARGCNHVTQDEDDIHFLAEGHDPADVETIGLPFNVFEEMTVETEEEPSEVLDYTAQPDLGGKTELGDTDAMDQIAHILSGEAWNATTMSEVAEIVQASGREIKDSND